MKAIYNAIKNTILEKVPEVKLVRLYSSQIDINLCPMVMIQFPEEIEYTELTRNTQTANLAVTLWVINENYEEDDLEVFDLKEKVNLALYKHSDGSFSPLIRISELVDSQFSQVNAFKIKYSTTFTEKLEDESEFQNITLGLNLVTELDIDNPIIRTGDNHL